jgi:hypothetical protein
VRRHRPRSHPTAQVRISTRRYLEARVRRECFYSCRRGSDASSAQRVLHRSAVNPLDRSVRSGFGRSPRSGFGWSVYPDAFPGGYQCPVRPVHTQNHHKIQTFRPPSRHLRPGSAARRDGVQTDRRKAPRCQSSPREAPAVQQARPPIFPAPDPSLPPPTPTLPALLLISSATALRPADSAPRARRD